MLSLAQPQPLVCLMPMIRIALQGSTAWRDLLSPTQALRFCFFGATDRDCPAVTWSVWTERGAALQGEKERGPGVSCYGGDSDARRVTASNFAR